MTSFTFCHPLRHASRGCVGTFAMLAVVVWLAGPRGKTLGTVVSGRFRSLGAGLAIAASLLLVAARPCAASPIFATYSGADAGSLDGVGFTLSGLSNPSSGNSITALDMAGANWNSVGSQQGRVYNANSVTTFAVTFAEPMSNL